MRACFPVYVVILLVDISVTFESEQCSLCIPKENCPEFFNISEEEQEEWIEEFACPSQQGFGLPSFENSDYICCPNNDADQNGNDQAIEKFKGSPRRNRWPNFSMNNWMPNFGRSFPWLNQNQNSKFEGNRRRRVPQQNLQQNPYFNPGNGGGNQGQVDNPYFIKRPTGPTGPTGPVQNPSGPSFTGPSGPNTASYPTGPTGQNPSGPSAPSDRGQGSNNRNNNGFGRSNEGQCSDITSFPPSLDSGCCGRDASETDRIVAPQYAPPVHRPSSNFNQNPWMSHSNKMFPDMWTFKDSDRRKRSPYSNSLDMNGTTVTLESRITGGKETDLDQYPWTVLLKITFDYGKKIAAFNCGGSIISAKYVLTAAHCLKDEGAQVKDVEIVLAEYDKRTFPKDCINTRGRGRVCIQNIKMQAEDIITHPQFDEQRLQNDIALIRLKGRAPYSEYIRPICLPPINIDNPQFSNLRLAVAGWGRDRQYTSEVKQSTVVNLVPQDKCVRSYPNLNGRHLCAAGYSGEDTCKGDSGGPLMMLYEGKYFVSGIVSGKRADSPCGTSVPSLYTNVYHYMDWIMSNLKP